MKEAVAMLREDLSSLRTSRANPALIENIKVTAYEGAEQLQLKELGSIRAEDANTLVVEPWDPKTAKNIAATVRQEDLGLSAAVSGNNVRVTMPPLSKERREEYVRLLKEKMESTRVMIRQIRSEQRAQILAAKEEGEISEDEAFRQEEQLQELTDRYVAEVDQLGDKKISLLQSL